MNKSINILLVEDSLADVRLTQEALKRSYLKYTLIVVGDGMEAMEYLRGMQESASESLPDVILLDLNMPNKDGHAVLQDIKYDQKLCKIPVILITVSNNDEDLIDALNLKMNYYLAKPITSSNLSLLISAILNLNDDKKKHLRSLSREETHIRMILAGNPNTSETALRHLASDFDAEVRCRVAENKYVPMNILEKLASDVNTEVRKGVCENPNVPASVLERMARDPDDDVRMDLSGNPNCPEYLLQQLIQDENIFVSLSASSTLFKRD